jgi:hypothetical protein
VGLLRRKRESISNVPLNVLPVPFAGRVFSIPYGASHSIFALSPEGGMERALDRKLP